MKWKAAGQARKLLPLLNRHQSSWLEGILKGYLLARLNVGVVQLQRKKTVCHNKITQECHSMSRKAVDHSRWCRV